MPLSRRPRSALGTVIFQARLKLGFGLCASCSLNDVRVQAQSKGIRLCLMFRVHRRERHEIFFLNDVILHAYLLLHELLHRLMFFWFGDLLPSGPDRISQARTMSHGTAARAAAEQAKP